MHLVEQKQAGITPVLLSKDTHPSFIGSWMLEDISVCDRLVEYFNNENTEYTANAGKVRGAQGAECDILVKNSLDKKLDFNAQACADYSRELQKCLNDYRAKYFYADNVAAYTDSVDFGNIQKYPKGGGYHSWHCERGVVALGHRHLVYMTYLNDVTDGGETEFLYQKLKVKPSKGLTLIWPTDWTHTHRGIPSPTQEKYIATGWYCYTGE